MISGSGSCKCIGSGSGSCSVSNILQIYYNTHMGGNIISKSLMLYIYRH